MTQQATRPESRIFSEIDPSTTVVHIMDPSDGFIFATTVAGIDEQLAINPNVVVLTSDNQPFER